MKWIRLSEINALTHEIYLRHNCLYIILLQIYMYLCLCLFFHVHIPCSTLQYSFFFSWSPLVGMICFFTFIIGGYSTAERKRSCSQQEGPVNGFHNNFGHSIGGVGYRGEEGVLIANILKPFVSKCVDNARELYGSDNIVCRIVHS